MTATPLGLCVASATAVSAEECTCSHDDGQACPMHPGAEKSKSSCSCRSTTDPSATVLASLLGPSADLPAAMEVAEPVLFAQSVPQVESSPIDAFALPDAPPPRA